MGTLWALPARGACMRYVLANLRIALHLSWLRRLMSLQLATYYI
jgi:hypothetical protein